MPCVGTPQHFTHSCTIQIGELKVHQVKNAFTSLFFFFCALETTASRIFLFVKTQKLGRKLDMRSIRMSIGTNIRFRRPERCIHTDMCDRCSLALGSRAIFAICLNAPYKKGKKGSHLMRRQDGLEYRRARLLLEKACMVCLMQPE